MINTLKIQTLLLIMGSVFYFQAVAQTDNQSIYPNGFHIGVLGEGNIAQKLSIAPFCGDYPTPEGKSTCGWKAGVEFSYHFYNYYGISVGIDYGTIAQFNKFMFIPLSEYFADGSDRMSAGIARRINRFQVPIQFEFHYPLKNNHFIICTALGVNLLNVIEAAGYAKNRTDRYSGIYQYQEQVEVATEDGSTDLITIYDDALYHKGDNAYKITADFLLHLGLCYRLPYSDLIRTQLTFNYSFKDRLYGYYSYPLNGSGGTMSYRHNYIGFELSYIHCFRTRAQRIALQSK